MRRVVVTGMGAITPIGNDVETFSERIKREETRIWTDHHILTRPINKAKLAA